MTTTTQTKDNEIQQQARDLLTSDPDLQAEEIPESSPKAKSRVSTNSIKSMFNKSVSSLTKKKEHVESETHEFKFVPLKMGGNGGTHKPSRGSRALITQEVSLADLHLMTEAFYDKAFQDFTLDKFIRSHNDPHGSRFAKWIHQKLTGSQIWDEDRRTRDLTPHEVAGGRTAVVHDRSSAHAAAWHSPKRNPRDVGRHFTLEECRVWMRLHFWAMREVGLIEKSPSFVDYYVRFIGHFVAVYERKAPQFARESFRWSAKASNIETYIKNGRIMKDVLGIKYSKALQQLPEEEAYDDEWPYNQSYQ